MIKQRLIEALRALEIPVDEIESIPAIGLLNPVVLTVLILEFIDLLPPEKQIEILHKPPIESLLSNRRIISALDFLCLYDCMASGKISLAPQPKAIAAKSITDIYNGFKGFLRRICHLVQAIISGSSLFPTQNILDGTNTQIAEIGENLLGLSPLVYCVKSNKTTTVSDISNEPLLGGSSTIQARVGKPFEFTFIDEEIDKFSYKSYTELPFSLDKYIYELNLATLRRVGVCTAPHDIHFSFHLTTTVCHDSSVKDTGTYYVPLHSPAPIILQPESSTFDQVEPELIELSRLRNTSDSEDGDDKPCERIFTQAKQVEEHVEILDPSYAKLGLEGLCSSTTTADIAGSSHALWKHTSNGADGVVLSLVPSSSDTKAKWFVDNSYTDSITKSSQFTGLGTSNTVYEDGNRDEATPQNKFSHLSVTASDKVYEVSPSSSQHSSFRASIEDNKLCSYSQSQSTSNNSGQSPYIYASDEDDSLAPARVTFNEIVEVDPGRYYRLKPFDEMQDVINSTALMNNMSIHIHELENKVSSLVSENGHLIQKYTATVNEHEHEKAALNASLNDALQKIKALETRILELEIKQSSDVYFAKLSASAQPPQSYTVNSEVTRSLTARPQRTRPCPEISFSPAQGDTAAQGTSKGQRDRVVKHTVTDVAVAATVPQPMDNPFTYTTHTSYKSNPNELGLGTNLELRDLDLNINLASTPARQQTHHTALDPLALSTPKQVDSLSNHEYALAAQRPSLFANMQRLSVTPMKSSERRDRRSESFDGSSQHLKKTKKHRTVSPGRERKDSSASTNSALVKEMLERIISSGSIQNKAYLVGANQVKAETLSSQMRSLSLEREAPMKPPGSPTSNARRFRHTSAVARGTRQ